MTDERKFKKEVQDAAHRFIASAKDDLDALKHAQECDGTRNGKPCKRGSEVRTYKGKDGNSFKMNLHDNPDAWHNEDRAREVIEQSPLSIEVRSDWHSVGSSEDTPAEYRILLGTGGPASQIVGGLDEYRQPVTAQFQYQDWFKPWTDAQITREEEDILIKWVSNFYFGG